MQAGAGEVAHRLQACIALIEDQSLVPCTTLGGSQPHVTPGGSDALF